jgi:hypothetical protein
VNTIVLADGRKLDRYTQQAVAAAKADARGADAGSTPAGARLPRTPAGVPNLSGAWAVEQQLMTDPRGRLGTLVPASSAPRFAPGTVPERGVAIPGSEGSGLLSLLSSSYRIAIGAISPSVIPWLDAPVARTERGRAALLPAERHPRNN